MNLSDEEVEEEVEEEVKEPLALSKYKIPEQLTSLDDDEEEDSGDALDQLCEDLEDEKFEKKPSTLS